MEKGNYLDVFLTELYGKLETSNCKDHYDACIMLVENYKTKIDETVVKNNLIKVSMLEFLDLLVKQIKNEAVELGV